MRAGGGRSVRRRGAYLYERREAPGDGPRSKCSAVPGKGVDESQADVMAVLHKAKLKESRLLVQTLAHHRVEALWDEAGRGHCLHGFLDR